ncbi:MAG: hypothetical protein AB1744_10210, partial [Candidatus Zixiibacteriota bacterium]
GGVYCDNTTSSVINNSIIWGNTAGCAAVDADFYAGPNTNVTLWYCDVGGHGGSNGNIDADPKFVDSTWYRLKYLGPPTPLSPCIEAGDSGYGPPSVDFEVDGRPYPVNGYFDIGWDEVVGY